MKLLKHKTERKGSRVRLDTAWRDHMRRPVRLKVTKEPAEDTDLHTMIECEDDAHLVSMLHGMAEIAWERGWRPRGLVNSVAYMIQNYKSPPEEK